MSMDQLYTDALKELEEVKAERDEYRDHLAAIAEMTGNGDDIGAAHEGVNALAEDLARHKRMFAAACETLGEIQQALGNSVVGIEPELVKELVEERDVLAAYAEEFCSAAYQASEVMDDLNRDQCEARHRLEHFRYNMPDAAKKIAARRDLLQQSQGAHKVAHAVLHTNLLRAQNLDKQEYAAGVATLIGNQLYLDALKPVKQAEGDE
ncbi:hypothetical protein ACIGG6_02615 [Vreelandella lionensis]|uniref:Uncharacterized protein n=1 Tax=Vreelandella lionensis TaxID=1144478 RepID=A0ABW8BQQ1_9GAMM